MAVLLISVIYLLRSKNGNVTQIITHTRGHFAHHQSLIYDIFFSLSTEFPFSIWGRSGEEGSSFFLSQQLMFNARMRSHKTAKKIAIFTKYPSSFLHHFFTLVQLGRHAEVMPTIYSCNCADNIVAVYNCNHVSNGCIHFFTANMNCPPFFRHKKVLKVFLNDLLDLFSAGFLSNKDFFRARFNAPLI